MKTKRILIVALALLGLFLYGCEGETTFPVLTSTSTTLLPSTSMSSEATTLSPTTELPTTLPPTSVSTSTLVPTTLPSTSLSPTTSMPTTTLPTTHLPIFYSEKETYVMDSGDLVLAIGWHDYAFTGMSGYEITSADYAMHMAGLTISGHYLTQLGVGSYHFSIVTDHGTYPLEIEIIYLSHYQEPSLYFLLGNDVYTLGLNLGLMAQIDLDGAPLLSVTIQDDPVNPAHYVLDGSTLELLPQALDGLSYGSAYRLMVVTEAGTDEALFIVNDIPTIQAKTDFIKYPGEAISDEDWTHLVDNQIGTITYRYECDAEGTFTDHGNGRFSFVPDSIYYGSEIIRLIVEDQYGAHAERAITLTYKQIDPIILDTEIALIVDKRLLANDLGFTVHTYGVEPSTLYFEMIDIREGSLSIGSEHFVLKTDGNPSWFSLKANYLLGLSVGLHTLRLLTEAGFSEFSLDIRDSRPVLAEPQTKTFTIGLSEEDLSFTLTPYEHIVTPSSFTIGIQSWTEGVDFTYIAPVLTIHKAFLETLALGSHTIAINDVETITLIIHTTLSPEVIQDDVLKLYAPLSEAALTIPIDLKGWTGETQVFRYQVPLDQADYTLTDELLTIATGYLDGLSEGYHEFFLINAQGSAGFMLRIAGSPAPSTPDQNVTKFTHEVITAEALRVETQWDASLIGLDLLEVRYYPYLESIEGEGILGIISEDAPASSGVFGTLTLNPDTITFALTRNPGWYGVVVFTYTATDDFGFTSNPIVMDVVYKPLHPDIADHDTKYYVLDTFTDITFTITNHEGNALFPIVDIAYGDETLVMDQDYTVGPEMGAYLYFTILGTYLDGLSGGTHTFVLITAGGRSTFYVHVVAPLSVAEAAEEFDQGHPEDITLTLQGFPLQISELRLQDQVVSSQYWTFAGNQLTLASAFLATLPYGTQDITVHNGYVESIIKVVITDTRMPILVGSIPTYTQGSWMDKTLTFNLYGESLIALRFQGEAVSLEDYTIRLHQLTIKGSYLESLSALPMLDFTIDTSYGPIPIQMEVVTLITPPEISQTSDPLAIDAGADIYFVLDLNGNTFAGLTYDDMELEIDDYGIDSTSGDLWLRLGFLLKIYDRNIDTYFLAFQTLEAEVVFFEVLYDAPIYRVLNGGFENGDLFGFQSYALWKDESGLVAFRNERVVETAYYGSGNDHPYHKDGVYHFGIYKEPYDNQNKDINQERMGMLRSANFTLGGSGWISFKMGGGRNQGVAYISVHDAQTDIEIARFGNRHFNNTTLSGTTNAEGYMFLYYYDLSAYLGQELYFLVVDQASHEWSVLALDSLYTYYEVAPLTTADTLAQNILPLIDRADDPVNEIIGGSLTSSLGTWENPQGVFQIGNGGAISSVGGNGAMGVLRSPAFTIQEHPYLKYDFAGAIAKDKQVFILVKEVGTNLEVLRLVRRDDLASQSDSGDFKSHWYDLSVLDGDKAYYLEVVDNRNGDWGVALIKNVRLEATPDLDYRMAVNAYYGLTQVHPDNGRYPQSVSDLSQIQGAPVYFVTPTPGADASSAFRLNFHAFTSTVYLEYTHEGDPDFTDMTRVKLTGVLQETPIYHADGKVYGFLPRYVFQAEISELSPQQTVLYRLRTYASTTIPKSYVTAPSGGGFRFLFFTDTQADYFHQAAITTKLIQEAYHYYDDYRFALITGDLVEVGMREADWERFYHSLPTGLPLMSIPGNHDYQDQNFSISSHAFYDLFFNPPQNFDPSPSHSSYYVIYDNVLFVMLDSVTDQDLANQQTWLLDVVDEYRQEFVIVATHYSMYGTYHEGSAQQMTTNWLQTFDQAQVDLVLSGHDHIYARTPRLTNGLPDDQGIYYLIGGSAGHKFRYVEGADGEIFSYYIEDTISTISMITITHAQILIETIDLDGTLVDTWVITPKPPVA